MTTTFDVPNNFTCEIGGGIESDGFFADESLFNQLENSLHTTISCSKSVKLQVFRVTMDELLDGSLELQQGLRRGFEVVYRADDVACVTCVASGGFCGSKSNEFACHCSDGPRPTTCQKPGICLTVFSYHLS